MMKVTILDAATLGDDLDLSLFSQFGDVMIYASTSEEQLAERISETDIIIVNKVKLNRDNLISAKSLKLICVAATGYDNIDIAYCRKNEIGVCNVTGYSTHSVAQVTVSMVLSLYTHLMEYRQYVNDGRYTQSGLQNYLKPQYHELYGKTWGVVGLGNIGRQVARTAQVMGCRVIACKRHIDDEFDCMDINELCAQADIISVHVPLSDETKNLIRAKQIAQMKDGVIFVNAARGAVADETALTEAIETGKIGGLGVDVYHTEPLEQSHPYFRIMHRSNVILTPHMAWGAYEARVRCMEEIAENIKSYLNHENRNRIEL